MDCGAMLRPMLTTAFLPVISLVSPLFVAASMSDAPEAPMVKLDVYMETLCPGSALFVKEELPKLFVNELSSIIDLSIVPWGNARMTSGGPQCQHGPVECQMNKRMSCFKHFHSKQSDLLQYAACSEGHSALDIDSAADKCIKALGFNVAEIHTCEAGPLGDQLQRKESEATDALQPPHLWVPWVVVNGQPIFDDLEHVQQYVCTAYTGPRPKACSDDPTAPPPSPRVGSGENKEAVSSSSRVMLRCNAQQGSPPSDQEPKDLLQPALGDSRQAEAQLHTEGV